MAVSAKKTALEQHTRSKDCWWRGYHGLMTCTECETRKDTIHDILVLDDQPSDKSHVTIKTKCLGIDKHHRKKRECGHIRKNLTVPVEYFEGIPKEKITTE